MTIIARANAMVNADHSRVGTRIRALNRGEARSTSAALSASPRAMAEPRLQARRARNRASSV